MASDSNNESSKITQGRSPAYPYINLGKAVERANQVGDAGVGRNAYPPETFYKIWKMGSQSSSSRQTMAALNHFGLVDYVGRGKDRKVKLSDLALKIVLDKIPGSDARKKAIHEAALKPPIHDDLWEKFGAILPDDVVLNTYLTLDCDYNADAANSLISEYKDTLEYAGLNKPDIMPEDHDEKQHPPEPAGVGDLVQRESEGVLRLEEPKHIRAIQEHDGQMWVFVEDYEAGFPMSEVIIEQKATDGGGLSQPPILPEDKDSGPAKGVRKAVFPVSDGDVIITFPKELSADGLEELDDYLNIFLKKEKREHKKKAQEAFDKADEDLTD